MSAKRFPEVKPTGFSLTVELAERIAAESRRLSYESQRFVSKSSLVEQAMRQFLGMESAR